MFKSMKIKNFRGLSDLIIKPLKKINIFVGDNCTGKTSILDAIFISINPNNPNLIASTNFFRNIIGINREYLSSYYYNLDIDKEIIIELNNNKKNRILRIKPIVLKKGIISDIDYNLSKVSEQKGIDFTGIETEVTGLSINFKIDKKDYESKIILYPDMPPRVEFDKDFVSDLNGRYLNNGTFNNSNIANIFSTIIQEKKKKQVIDFLRNFKSTIDDINLVENNIILVDDSEFTKSIDINLYGNGLVKSLQIFESFLVKNEDILLIDEVENGLHFSKQKNIWEAIIQLTKRNDKQTFITTHSSEMLKSLYEVAIKNNSLSLVSLFRLEKVDNKIQCINYSEEQFKNAIELNLETR